MLVKFKFAKLQIRYKLGYLTLVKPSRPRGIWQKSILAQQTVSICRQAKEVDEKKSIRFKLSGDHFGAFSKNYCKCGLKICLLLALSMFLKLTACCFVIHAFSSVDVIQAYRQFTETTHFFLSPPQIFDPLPTQRVPICTILKYPFLAD